MMPEHDVYEGRWYRLERDLQDPAMQPGPLVRIDQKTNFHLDPPFHNFIGTEYGKPFLGRYAYDKIGYEEALTFGGWRRVFDYWRFFR